MNGGSTLLRRRSAAARRSGGAAEQMRTVNQKKRRKIGRADRDQVLPSKWTIIKSVCTWVLSTDL